MCQSEVFFPPKNGMNVLYLFFANIFYEKKTTAFGVVYLYVHI